MAVIGLACVPWLATCSETGTAPEVPPPAAASIRASDSPKPDIEQRLRAFTGPESVLCGERPGRPALAITSEAMDGWLTCARQARASGHAFRVLIGYSGDDWWTARGWVGSEDGTLHEFVYTISAPSGRTTFEVRRCGEITGHATGRAPFTCVPPGETGLE